MATQAFQIAHNPYAPTTAEIERTQRSLGLGSWRITRVIHLHDTTEVVVERGASGKSDQRRIEEQVAADKGLPAWAASFPWEPEPYWRERDADG